MKTEKEMFGKAMVCQAVQAMGHGGC